MADDGSAVSARAIRMAGQGGLHSVGKMLAYWYRFPILGNSIMTPVAAKKSHDRGSAPGDRADSRRPCGFDASTPCALPRRANDAVYVVSPFFDAFRSVLVTLDWTPVANSIHRYTALAYVLVTLDWTPVANQPRHGCSALLVLVTLDWTPVANRRSKITPSQLF